MSRELNYIIQYLDDLSWNGIAIPCGNVTTNFSHSLADQAYPYVDGHQHSFTGRNPYEVSATLYFLNSLPWATDAVLFPGVWSRFLESVNTGKIGELRHPDPSFGTFYARVKDVSIKMEATATSGVVVDVTWVETVKAKVTEIKLQSYQSLVAAAVTALQGTDQIPFFGTLIATVNKKYNLPIYTGELSTDLEGIFDSVMGIGTNILMQASGQLNQIRGRIQKINNLLDPNSNPLVCAAADVMDALEETLAARIDASYHMGQRLSLGRAAGSDVGRPIKTYLPPFDMTHEQIARATRNTEEEVFELNPSSLRLQVIPTKMPMKYYSDNES